MDPPREYTPIRNLVPAMRNVNLYFIVLEIYPPNRTKDGNVVRTVKIADHTGSVNLSVWNEIGDALQSGDICRLHHGFTTVFKSSLCVSCGKLGEIQRVDNFCMIFNETLDMSVPNPEFAQYNKQTGESGGDETLGNPGNPGTVGIAPGEGNEKKGEKPKMAVPGLRK